MSERDSLQKLPESNAEETSEFPGREGASRSGGAEMDLEHQTGPEGTCTSEVDRSESASQHSEGQLHQTDDCGSYMVGPVGDQTRITDQSLSQVEQGPVNSATCSGSELPTETVEDVSDALTNVHLVGPSKEVVDEATHRLSGNQSTLQQRDPDHRGELASPHSEASLLHTLNQQLQGFENIGEPDDSLPRGPGDLGRPTTLGAMASLTSSGQEAVDSPQPGSPSDSCEEESGRLSPFLIVSKSSIANVAGLESPGLLYASGPKEKDNRSASLSLEI